MKLLLQLLLLVLRKRTSIEICFPVVHNGLIDIIASQGALLSAEK